VGEGGGWWFGGAVHGRSSSRGLRV